MSETEIVAFDFQANGVREVTRAFETIEQTMIRAEKASIESAKRDAKGRFQAAQDGAKQRVGLEKKVTADFASEWANQLRADMAAHTERRKQAGQTAKTQIEKAKTVYQSLAGFEVEFSKKHAEEVKKRARAEEDAHKQVLDRRRQYAQMIGGTAVGSVRSMASTAAHWGGAALTIGGALSATKAAQSFMSAETASVALANSMFNPNDKEQQTWLAKNGVGGRFDNRAIMSFAGKTQASTGIGKDELARGWQDYIAKSSDWKSLTTDEGRERLTDMAKLAKATGSDFGQVMGAAGMLKVQNPNLSDKQMMEMMYSIVGQGKMGAVEMKDLAAHASVITSGSGSFAMEQRKAQTALLGLSQIAVRTSGSPAEAATAVARFSGDVQHHAKDMKSTFGINAIADEKTGALKSPSEILAEIFEKTGGNTAKFGEGKGNVGLGRESVRIAQALTPTYQSAVQVAKNSGEKDEKKLAKIGAEAVRQEVLKFENASYSKGQTEEDLKRTLATTQERFNKVITELTEKLETRVVPFLEKLAAALEKNAPQLEKFMDALASVATWLAENPWIGLGAIIATKITTDIGAALIGEAVKNTLTKLLANTMGAGGGGGAGSALGGAGIGTAGLIAAGAVIQIGSLIVTAMEVKEWKDAGAREGESVANAMKSGDAGRQAAAAMTLKDANQKGDAVGVTAAIMERFAFVAQAIANPGGALLTHYSGEEIEKQTGIKSGKTRSLESIKAHELIDVYDLKMKIAGATYEGFKAGMSNANATERNATMTTPARGGTGNGQ